ncbi:hypothetical protein HYDPIDRAFT_177473 [Hydnomerulius pinastri MD-312]|uniref:Uncharacterized protein n=1 Tax=Hydnomerulius pinastri MD-312 TaxID=994086 RepID=A0A0C9WAV6_9AGAM|nr:hypothetical protein HYDPIDRAFT_177473 [Hydnomerulius pinastri MD-312]
MAGIDLILREVADPTTEHNFGVDDESALMETGLDDADSHFQPSFPEMGRAGIAAAVSKLLGEDELSEEEDIEQSDEEDGIEGVRGDDNEGMKTLNKLAAANINMAAGDGMKTGEWDTTQGQNEWFPWPDKLVNLLTWVLHINGISDVPSVKTLKNLEDGLQKICGIKTLSYEGALGHKYFMNSFADIVRQEMANPRVRHGLHFYPEDSGKRLTDARQAERWLDEMDPAQLTPMVRLQNQDFFVFEPALLSSVEEHNEIEIPQNDFLVSFKNWNPWTLTDPLEGNRWRVLAGGARVYAFPIWLYCDDTSGNLSKRWNKHNSFLFTPAGLPRAEVHQEYNVHFLCTSNLASPLEMLDGFVDQLAVAQDTGIWAWDCVHREQVLVIPSVLALLGDNPMQSELACHVGLMGKYFCRVCNIKGHDAQDVTSAAADSDRDDTRSGDGSAQGRRMRKRAKESMSDMVERIKCFVKLKSMFEMGSLVGNQTKIKEKKTSSGLKDTYLDHFLDYMGMSYKKKRGNEAKQQALDECISGLPKNVYSPVWRIKGLNPHMDTPVEVLHTILLGFVKYFWRDAVNVRVGKDKLKRELLKTRLSSFNMTGLGISPLSGHTFVQYAGSLVGRDFRAIAQAAPFVLHGLELLDAAIRDFLACTARWTPCWFNKPKFHILLHLPDHIRRFGPAALFATEGFESFNAVIRAKSIHSNRQSPSRDIARAFTHGNRIRHILSGAHILIRTDHPDLSKQVKKLFEMPDPNIVDAGKAGVWRPIGTAPLQLVDRPNIVTEYMGLDIPTSKNGHQFPNALSSLPQETLNGNNFRTCKAVILMNGDKCIPDQWLQEIVKPYSMPSVRHDVSFLLLPIEVSHLSN